MSGEDGDIPKLAYGSIEAAAEREKKNIHPKEPLIWRIFTQKSLLSGEYYLENIHPKEPLIWRMSRLNYS